MTLYFYSHCTQTEKHFYQPDRFFMARSVFQRKISAKSVTIIEQAVPGYDKLHTS